MTFNALMKDFQLRKRLNLANTITVIEELRLENDEEDSEENTEKLNQILTIITKDILYNGSGNDFHNLAVTLARKSLYAEACQVIEVGLSLYENNTDLLADYLSFASQCNKWNDAQIKYEKLISINKLEWTWRSFSFSIDYLIELFYKKNDSCEKEIINKQMNVILTDFFQLYDENENPYFAEYAINNLSMKKEKAIEIMETKLCKKSNMKAPKCYSKLAEHYFKKHEYITAINYIEKCKGCLAVVQPSIKAGYVYMLSALIRISEVYDIGIATLGDAEKQEYAKRIYQDCEAAETAYMHERFSNFKNLELQRDLFEKLIKIPYYGSV